MLLRGSCRTVPQDDTQKMKRVSLAGFVLGLIFAGVAVAMPDWGGFSYSSSAVTMKYTVGLREQSLKITAGGVSYDKTFSACDLMSEIPAIVESIPGVDALLREPHELCSVAEATFNKVVAGAVLALLGCVFARVVSRASSSAQYVGTACLALGACAVTGVATAQWKTKWYDEYNSSIPSALNISYLYCFYLSSAAATLAALVCAINVKLGIDDYQRRTVKTEPSADLVQPLIVDMEAPAPSNVSVVVPAGASAGMHLQVVTPDGKMITTLIPEGAVPGSSFNVPIPPPPPVTQLAIVPTPPAEPDAGARIATLQALLDADQISQADFEKRKQAILDAI